MAVQVLLLELLELPGISLSTSPRWHPGYGPSLRMCSFQNIMGYVVLGTATMVALPEIAENYEKAEYIISIMDVYVKGLLSFCHLKLRSGLFSFGM